MFKIISTNNYNSDINGDINNEVIIAYILDIIGLYTKFFELMDIINDTYTDEQIRKLITIMINMNENSSATTDNTSATTENATEIIDNLFNEIKNIWEKGFFII